MASMGGFTGQDMSRQSSTYRTSNLPEGSAVYEVQFTYSGYGSEYDRERIRTRNVIITAGYTVFEDMRKIIVLRLSGNADDLDKIDILTVTKVS
jgi:hypothetical protein